MGFYSYNGYILPELPQLAYPYAALYAFGDCKLGLNATLLCIDRPFQYDVSTGYFVPADANCIRYIAFGAYDDAVAEWKENMSGVGLDRETNGSIFVWTNQNVYATDGSLYLKATDPEPIESIAVSGDYMYLGDLSRKVPEWPEWNRTKYPHAMIVKCTSGDYEIYSATFSSLPFQYKKVPILSIYEIAYSTPGSAKYCTQYYINAFDRPIWSAPYSSEWTIEISDYSDTIAWEVVWHTGLYNEAGELIEEPSPQPRTIFPLADWLGGYVLGMMEKPQVTFRNPYPIEWRYPDMMENYKIETESGYAVLVSGYVMSAEEYQYLVLEVTENGVVSTYRFKEVFMGTSDLDSLMMGDNSEYGLMNTKKPGGAYQTVGIYALQPKSDTTSKQYRLLLVKEG